LVSDVPGMPDRRGVARRAEHDVCAFIGALARHFREHPVVTDDESNLAAVWAVAHGNADVSRLPRLNRYPRMQLAVIELLFAAIVNDDAAIVGLAIGVVLHNGKTAPNAVLAARLAERFDLGAIAAAHDLRVCVHR